MHSQLESLVYIGSLVPRCSRDWNAKAQARHLLANAKLALSDLNFLCLGNRSHHHMGPQSITSKDRV